MKNHWIAQNTASHFSLVEKYPNIYQPAGLSLVTVLESGLYAALADESAELLTKFQLHHAFFLYLIFKVVLLLI